MWMRDPCGRTLRHVIAVVSYGLAIVGLIVISIAAAPAFVARVKFAHARTMIINALRTDPNRAESLCRAAKGTFFEPIGAAIAAVALTRSRDPKTIAAVSLPAFDGSAMLVTTQWKAYVTKAKLGAMAVAGGLGLAYAKGLLSPWLIVIAIACGLVGGWLLVRKAELERSMLRARGEVMPEVDRAFVDGRYQV
jgi:hypothetical protein